MDCSSASPQWKNDKIGKTNKTTCNAIQAAPGIRSFTRSLVREIARASLDTLQIERRKNSDTGHWWRPRSMTLVIWLLHRFLNRSMTNQPKPANYSTTTSQLMNEGQWHQRTKWSQIKKSMATWGHGKGVAQSPCLSICHITETPPVANVATYRLSLELMLASPSWREEWRKDQNHANIP